MTDRKIIEPSNPKLNASRNYQLPHSPCVRAGEFLFLSGMVSIDPETGGLRKGSIAEETRQILENMEHLLKSAGRGLQDVIKTTAFIHDMSGLDEFIHAYRQFFPVNPPASTVCGVQLSPDLKVEIECIALA